MGKLTYLVIHCTASREGVKVSPGLIKQIHMAKPPKGHGWSRVGYTEMVHLDGSVDILSQYNENDQIENFEMTYGQPGINSISRHIVYVGGVDSKLKPKDTRTPEQKESLELIVKHTILLHPDILVAGHNQFTNKACPSFDTVNWLKSIGVEDKNIYNN